MIGERERVRDGSSDVARSSSTAESGKGPCGMCDREQRRGELERDEEDGVGLGTLLRLERVAVPRVGDSSKRSARLNEPGRERQRVGGEGKNARRPARRLDLVGALRLARLSPLPPEPTPTVRPSAPLELTVHRPDSLPHTVSESLIFKGRCGASPRRLRLLVLPSTRQLTPSRPPCPLLCCSVALACSQPRRPQVRPSPLALCAVSER